MHKTLTTHRAKHRPPAFSTRRCAFYLLTAGILMHLIIGSALGHTLPTLA